MKIEYMAECLVLAQTLNFSAAARQLGISQPVLSAHIKALEKELGFSLFARNKHSVSLTEMGSGLLADMTQVVERHNRMMQTAHRLQAKLSSSLSVGYLYNAFRDLLPDVAVAFSNSHPGIGLQMRSFGYKGVTDALVQGLIDIAFTIDVDPQLHSLCNSFKIGEDPLCCVVRKDDPLAQYDRLQLADLSGESFILPHPYDSGNFARFYDGLFEQAGFAPKTSMHYRDIDTRYLAIEAGEGIALVGRHFERAMDDDVKFIPLVEEYCKYDLVALWLKSNPNTNVEKLMRLLGWPALPRRTSSGKTAQG